MNIAFIFPSQGSQAIGMGSDFYNNSEIAKLLTKEASEKLEIDFKTILFTENDEINQSQYTQPSILLTSIIALNIFLKERDIKPIFSLGHSLGEFSALVSVGALDLFDALSLVQKRGLLMQQCNGGMMVVLGLNDLEAQNICQSLRNEGKQIWCANYNVEGQIVISGVKADLESSQTTFLNQGAKKCMILNMSTASHSPLLNPIVEDFAFELESRLQDSFAAPVISNVTATPYSKKEDGLRLLKEQLTKPVLYKQSIMENENLVDCFIEFGHGGVLKGLNKRITKKPTFVVQDFKTLKATLEELKC